MSCMRSMNKICNPRAKTHALTHNAASHLFNESHSALESTFFDSRLWFLFINILSCALDQMFYMHIRMSNKIFNFYLIVYNFGNANLQLEMH